MTTPISAIGAVAPISGTSATGAASATSSTSGAGFADALGKGLDAVSGAQSNADNLAIQASTGALVDPAALTVATTQATLMTQLAATVQSKAVTAFNTIMGMQA